MESAVVGWKNIFTGFRLEGGNEIRKQFHHFTFNVWIYFHVVCTRGSITSIASSPPRYSSSERIHLGIFLWCNQISFPKPWKWWKGKFSIGSLSEKNSLVLRDSKSEKLFRGIWSLSSLLSSTVTDSSYANLRPEKSRTDASQQLPTWSKLWHCNVDDQILIFAW